MTDPGAEAASDELAPEDAFTLLGNETRVAILQALVGADEPVGFGELREAVGVSDSGQFNYHLGRLTGRFVRKVTGDDGGPAGYELTLAGEQVTGAILAGSYTQAPTFEPIELDDPCPECGGPLVAAYEDEHVRIRCVDRGEWTNTFTFPPRTVEQFDRDELPLAFDRWLRTMAGRIVAGFCTNCSGRLAGQLVPDVDHPEDVRAEYRCEHCGQVAEFSLYLPLLFHPAGIAYLHDHGLDVTATPTWDIDRRVDEAVELVAAEPYRARVTMELDGERFVAEFGPDATVESTAREAVGDDR